MDDHIRLTYWNQGNTHPELWEVQARNLAYSAQVLYLRSARATETLIREKPISGTPEASQLLADMSMATIAFMLAGFAIENVLKGIRVQQINIESPVLEGDIRVKSITSTHNLARLASDAGITLTAEENKLFDKLTDLIIWSGRYPRPKRPEDFMKEDPESGGLAMALSPSDWSNFVAAFNSLIRRIPPPSRGRKSNA